MKLKHLRAILCFPAFFAYLVIAQSICQMAVGWLYSKTFPIDGFFDFFFAAGFGIPMMLTAVIIFLGGILSVISIAPNTRLASRIYLVTMLIAYGISYANSFLERSGWVILLDILVFVVVLTEAMKPKRTDIAAGSLGGAPD